MNELLPCPFCGTMPIVEHWHGGSPTKVMVSCRNDFDGKVAAACAVTPSVTGCNLERATRKWNNRSAPLEWYDCDCQHCAPTAIEHPGDGTGTAPHLMG